MLVSFNLPLRLRLEPAAENPEGTMVVEVPVDAGEGVRTARDLTMWEQLSFAAFLQRYWADNQASVIISLEYSVRHLKLAQLHSPKAARVITKVARAERSTLFRRSATTGGVFALNSSEMPDF